MTPLAQSKFLERVRALKCEVARARQAVSEQKLSSERASEQDCRLAKVQSELQQRQRLSDALARFNQQDLQTYALHQVASEYDCMAMHWQGKVQVTKANRMMAERDVRQGLIAEQMAERGHVKATHLRDEQQALENLSQAWREELIDEDYLSGQPTGGQCLSR